MWDDARQLNAIALTLTPIAASRCSRWARSAGSTRQPAFEFREVVVDDAARARERRASRSGDPRASSRGTFFTMDLDARARVARARALGARASRCAGSGRDRLEIEVDEHAAARALERQRARRHAAAKCSSRATPANCRSSTGPDGQAAVMTARYRDWRGAARAARAARSTRSDLSARGGWQLRAATTAGR